MSVSGPLSPSQPLQALDPLQATRERDSTCRAFECRSQTRRILCAQDAVGELKLDHAIRKALGWRRHEVQKRVPTRQHVFILHYHQTMQQRLGVGGQTLGTPLFPFPHLSLIQIRHHSEDHTLDHTCIQDDYTLFLFMKMPQFSKTGHFQPEFLVLDTQRQLLVT